MKPFLIALGLLAALSLPTACTAPPPPLLAAPAVGAPLQGATGLYLRVATRSEAPRRLSAWAADIETYVVRLKSAAIAEPGGVLTVSVPVASVDAASGEAAFAVLNLRPTQATDAASLYEVSIQLRDRGGNVVNARDDGDGFVRLASGVAVQANEIRALPRVSVLLTPNHAPAFEPPPAPEPTVTEP